MSTGPVPDYEDLRRHVVKAVSRLSPPRLSADRDDIVQAAMIRLHRLQTANEGATPTAASYIWKTAFSVVIDEIRRRQRRSEAPLSDMPQVDRLADGAPDAERRAVARELGTAIRACLGAMAAARRAAVVLHLQGHTVPDVGRLLGHHAKKAENLVYRGMTDLRRCLEAKGVRP